MYICVVQVVKKYMYVAVKKFTMKNLLKKCYYLYITKCFEKATYNT